MLLNVSVSCIDFWESSKVFVLQEKPDPSFFLTAARYASKHFLKNIIWAIRKWCVKLSGQKRNKYLAISGH